MKHFVDTRWFGLVDFACVTAAILLWELKPELQALPLLAALIPWGLRVIDRKFPFYRTAFDIPLFLFLITASIGAIITYNQAEGLNKYWLVVGGILLFYALAGQTPECLRIIASGVSMLGPAMAAFFLLTNKWAFFSAKIDFLNRLGLEWMKIRPVIPSIGFDPHPNLASGIIVVTAPFLIYFGLQAWQKRNYLSLFWVSAGSILSLTALLLATSRGALIALAAGMGAWLLAAFAQRRGIRVPARLKLVWFGSGLIFVLAGAWLVFSFIGGSADLEANPEPSSTAASRLELSQSALKLLGDFPFSGGGLHSFSGLYSNYIQVIPNFKIINSHNQYLDIALEQGPVGLLAFLLIYSGSFWLLWNHSGGSGSSWMKNISLASLVILCIHGVFDDFIFNAWVTPLIFFLPGIIFAITRSEAEPAGSPAAARTNILPASGGKPWLLPVVGAGIILAFFMLVSGVSNSLLASWYSNLGAIKMARVELANFPSLSRDDGRNAASLKPAEDLFLQALQADPQNRTANHRLGLIELSRRNFQTAVSYLEAAYHSDPAHRGIWKSLGYAYVWTGQFDRALAMLDKIPEANPELVTYAWWWGTLGRQDLSKNAEIMAAKLAGQRK